MRSLRALTTGIAPLVVLAVLAAPSPAAAQGAPGDADKLKEATSLFTTGSELHRAKKYTEALALLQRSHELVPSPNSELLVARCLRDMGRTAEAAEAYDETEREAAARAASGDARYAEAASAAASERDELRPKLGALRIHLVHATSDVTVLVDGARAKLDGDAVRVWHAPGQATVTLRAPPRAEQVKVVDLRAGAQAELELDAAPPAATVPVAPPTPRWMVPTVAAASAVGVAGIAMAIGFGASSRATFDDLSSSCGARCTTPSEQDQISGGKRNQAIANASIAFGVAGAAVAATVGVLLFRSSRAQGATGSLVLGPGSVGLAGRF